MLFTLIRFKQKTFFFQTLLLFGILEQLELKKDWFASPLVALGD